MRDGVWCRWVQNGCKTPKTPRARIKRKNVRRARINAVSKLSILLRIYDQKQVELLKNDIVWAKNAAAREKNLASSYKYNRATVFFTRLLFEDGFGERVAPTLSKGDLYRRFAQLIVTYTLNYIDWLIRFKEADKSKIEELLKEAREAGITNPKAAARAMFRELENELITGSNHGSK